MSRQLATFVIAAVVITATASQIQAHQVPAPVTPAAPTPMQGAPPPAVLPVVPVTQTVPVQPPTPAPPRQGGRGAAPPAPGSPVATPVRPERIPTQNVKVDLTITDTFGGSGSTKKTVTLLVADGWSGRIRSSNEVQVPYPGGSTVPGGAPFSTRTITINVDCTPIVREGNRIQLNISLEYVPELSTMNASATATTTRDPKPANINESLTVLVNDGKPTLLTQSADPATDRRVTVEATATVVK